MAPAHNIRQLSGFTLVELIVTLLLMSIAVLGISQSLAFGLRHQSDAVWQVKSVALAEAYMEEILARPYDENTPTGGIPPCSPATTACSTTFSDGESRPNYDDVDDYNGLDESPPRDAEDVVRAGYVGYRVQVAVRYLNASEVTAFALDATTDAKLISLTVSSPGNTAMNFTAVKGNF